MSRTGSWTAMGTAVLLMLSACASPPTTHFHSLLAAQPAAVTPAATQSIGWTLLPVDIPAQVDRPQMVLRQADGSLAVLEHDRWIAPLDEELHAAIAERLSARLGPANGMGTTSTDEAPHWRIRIDVLRFDSTPGSGARLVADWTLQASRRSAACRSSIDEAAGASVGELVQAHQRAVGRLGDVVAEGLVRLERGGEGVCMAE